MSKTELPKRKDKEPPKERQAWTIQEFCREFRVSRSNLYLLIRAGKIHTVTIGGRRLVPVSEGERLLAGGRADESLR